MTRLLEIVAGIHRRTPFGVAITVDRFDAADLRVLRDLDARATFFLDEYDDATVDVLRRAGHGIGWRTEHAHDQLVRIEERVITLHRPALPPTSINDAIRMRKRRLDAWLWSVDEHDVDRVRDRDVVRVTDDVARVVSVVRDRGLEPVVL